MNTKLDFKSILLATDFSERSAAAELHAVALAEKFNASLHVVSAIEPIMGIDDGDEDADEFVEFYDRLAQRADLEMEKRLETWGATSLAAKHHVKIGPRWQVILECAEEADADLVILGRSSSAKPEGPLGTTSQKVFYASQRPVMFVSERE